MKRRLTPLAILVLLAACAVPVQSVLVDQPAAQTTPAGEAAVPVVTVPPPATPLPGPATLENALLVSLWDEATDTAALAPVDPRTGEAVPGYDPLVLGEGFSSARSADGRLLATINYGGRGCEAWAGGTRCQPDEGVLHFIDLAAWRDTATGVRVPGHASFVVFSGDGRYLALGQSDWPAPAVLLVDVAGGTLAGEIALDFFPTQAAFSADGRSLLVYGRHYTESNGFNPEPRVAALDTETVSVRWQAALPQVLDGQYVPPEARNVHDESVWWLPGVVFAPEAARLYLVHADVQTLTTVDFAAQTVHDRDIGPAQSWLDRLMALTAGVAEAKIMNGYEARALLAGTGNEQRLYVVGASTDSTEGTYTRTPLGLVVIDPATGVELLRREGVAGAVTLAPDGAHLFVTDWDGAARTEIIDRASLDTVAELTRREIIVTQLVNGQAAAFALRVAPRETSVRWLDPATLGELAEWTAPSTVWVIP